METGLLNVPPKRAQPARQHTHSSVQNQNRHKTEAWEILKLQLLPDVFWSQKVLCGSQFGA